MTVTPQMRQQRALKYLKDEQRHEQKAMEALEGINIREVIIIRNKKQMYMAELDQMIRNIENELKEAEEAIAS